MLFSVCDGKAVTAEVPGGAQFKPEPLSVSFAFAISQAIQLRIQPSPYLHSRIENEFVQGRVPR